MKKLVMIFIFALSIFLVACSNSITVTYVINEVEATETLEMGSVFEKDASVTGYEFKGWYKDSSFEEKYSDEELTKDIKLYAKLEKAVYKVTFKSDDIVVKEEEVAYNDQITSIVEPTKDGYTFIRYKDEEGATLTLPLTVTEDKTYYAEFAIEAYDVIFKNGEETLKEEKVEYLKEATAPTDPEKEGHDFKGWDKEFNSVTGNLVVNAIWEVKTFTVKFYEEDGTTLIKEVEAKYQTSVTPPNPKDITGYVFLGWDKDITNIKESFSTKATYKISTFKVKFLSENKILKEEEVEYLKSATAPSDPEKDGYTFNGWDKTFTSVTQNLEVNANFTIVTYEILYYDNDTAITHTPSSFTIEDSITLTEKVKEGYLFLGWYDKKEGGEKKEVIDKGTNEAITLYAKYFNKDDIKTLNYELNGGTFTFTNQEITDPGKGISSISNLPEFFAQDFYTYLKDNNLLASPKVASNLQVTNYAQFIATNPNHSGDPHAIWLDTSSNTSSTTDGYQQFLYDSATGDSATGTLLTIEGGFLGSEPYKSKYYTFSQYLSLMQHNKYSVEFFASSSAKSLAGFIIDGYFYGTQGAGSGNFLELRKHIPNTDLGYRFVNNVLEEYSVEYHQKKYQGEDLYLPLPSKSGYVFCGWYTNDTFTSEKIEKITSSDMVSAKYYAKWEIIS